MTLAIYTMIGLEQHGAGDLHSALDAVSHLLAGAVWYGLLSILWTALFANRPVRERVARLYQELGRYLQLKAALFEPVRKQTCNVANSTWPNRTGVWSVR